jgi:tellurite resistance protein TehA-like permease
MPPAQRRARPSLRLLGAQLPGWIDRQIESLHPGSFALVMATGIISNALFVEGPRPLSNLLFAANAVAYLWLAILTILRAVRFPRTLWSDLGDPRLVFSFFTFVAGTDVLGEGAYLRGFASAALYLWLLALLVWFVLVYIGFAVLTFLNTMQSADVILGGWLLAVVGTESLVILGTAVAHSTQDAGSAVSVLIHMLWGLGLGLYAIYMAQFTFRLFYFAIEPDDITPVLWVIMGAAAISTNAGSSLMEAHDSLRFLHEMLPFVQGVTLIAWAWASFWVPLLLMFEIWKYAIRRAPMTFTPLLWSAVFPLGMYSVATLRLSTASDFSPLHAISQVMLWIALSAWILIAAALARASWRSFREFAQSASQECPQEQAVGCCGSDAKGSS